MQQNITFQVIVQVYNEELLFYIGLKVSRKVIGLIMHLKNFPV